MEANEPTRKEDEKFCRDCGKTIRAKAEICPHCGIRQLAPPNPLGQGRNRLVAVLFALILGGLGIHKFYLGQVLWGVVYLVFCWTFIPALVGFIEGILLLTQSDEAFDAKFNQRQATIATS